MALSYSPQRRRDWNGCLTISVWAAVLLTIYSGGIYIHRAIMLLRG